MNTDKKGIRNLAEICARKGLSHFVLSPGSRCAPLVIALNRHPKIHCLSIVDERSAAFFALGMAQQLRKPVGLVCTSGSAVLNYAPALAEAYYQKIPLVVFTADRPNEWIDQGENQSINQYRIYNNFIKKSFSLPVQMDDKMDLWYGDRLVSEAINTSTFPEYGPVHINIPLREPLYNLVGDDAAEAPKVIESHHAPPKLDQQTINQLKESWGRALKKIIIAGSQPRNEEVNNLLSQVADDPSVIVLNESISNVYDDRFIDCIDPLVEVVNARNDDRLLPDMVLSFGGSVVSKKLKFLFRKQHVRHHWHISPANEHWDTFQSLTNVLVANPVQILTEFAGVQTPESTYRDQWLDLKAKITRDTAAYLDAVPFTDFKVFERILDRIPANTNIHFGNSTPVRYGNLFALPREENYTINSNRGISGIDGQVSTAAGAAFANKRLTVCITGDVGFLYDSNALWNKHLTSNFRIIVINNSGGNIFRIIPGPDRLGELEEFFETGFDIHAKPLAEMYGLPYYYCDNEEDLINELEIFFKPHAGRAAILEIKTPNKLSAEVLRDYFKYLIEKDKATQGMLAEKEGK